MSYSARNISSQRQINEGWAEIVEESSELQATIDAEEAAHESDWADEKANAIRNIVTGTNPEFGTEMSMQEWGDMLNAIQATPEQRKLYEEAQRLQSHGDADSSLDLIDLMGGDFHPGHL